MLQRIKEVAEVFLKDIRSARVIAHYDADGIAAAGIICNLLFRSKIKFYCTLAKDFSDRFIDKLASEKQPCDLAIFLDLGSNKIEEIENLQGGYKTIIILDHHTPKKESQLYQINPHLFGIDGSYECCASSLAYLLGESIAESNHDLVGLALAGITGDKQLPLQGINKEMAERGMKNDELKFEKGFSLTEEEFSIEKIYDARLGDERYLNSIFLTYALKQGVDYEVLEQKFNRYYITRYKMYAHELASILDACGRKDNTSLGLAICLSSDFISKGKEVKACYGEELKKELAGLEKRVKTVGSIQYFKCNNSSLAGVVAGIGINYLLDKDKPILAYSPREWKLKISARGSKELVRRGLDLATALRKGAEAVGGYGGGHPVAAGATIPKNKLQEFIKIVKGIISKQLS